MFFADLEVVVVGVLGKSTVEKGPREVIKGILLRLDAACHDLSVDMVHKAVVQMRLHG